MTRPPATRRPRTTARFTALAASLLAGAAAILFAAPTRVSAAEGGGSGGLGAIGDWLRDGGEVMYVILGLSILGTAIFLERAFDLYFAKRLASKAFLAKVVDLVEARRYSAAIDACDVRTSHPLVRVVKAGLLRANRKEKEIERAMEKEMLGALPGLQKRVGIMALLANTATLAGLLGTIFGLITAFNSVAVASAAERQTALAGGISEAMYTTAFGISVAVPLLFFHHFLARRLEQIVMEVEEGATAMLLALSGGRARTPDDEPAYEGAPAFELGGAASRA